MFLQPEVVNLFDEDGLTNNTLTDTLDFNNNGRCPNGAGGLCEDFNALTTTPVLGTHYVLDENFDNAEDEDDFQQPRTFRLSVGFRF